MIRRNPLVRVIRRSVDVSRIDSRLLAVCTTCGMLFRHHLHRLRRCETCWSYGDDLPPAEIERRFQAAKAANAHRFRLTPADLWRDSSMAGVVDRGPETEVGVAFPEAW